MDSEQMRPVARVGFATKGAVYMILGLLAVLRALGDRRGKLEGSAGAVRSIGEQPFGQALLVAAGVGLAAYTIYRLFQVVRGPEDEDVHGLKAAGMRAGYLISAIGHGGLAVLAFQLVLGGRSSGGQGSGVHAWVARLMSAPFGQALVAGVGIGLCVYALYQAYRAAKGKLPHVLPGGDGPRRPWLDVLGRAGMAARGVVFGIIGYWLIRAGLDGRARESKDVGGALRELTLLPEGTFVLGVVAAGLIGYGLYMFACAAYPVRR